MSGYDTGLVTVIEVADWLWPRWVPVTEQRPLSGRFVLASVLGPNGKRCTVRAQWADRFTLEADDFDGWAEEGEDGEAYCPAGWYETNEYEDAHWCITDAVTHWMPLPPPPDEP